ncbi:three-Cys-motif partner protein TcmP [Salipaludibacillus sp. HK11]|uniref:three-Cys-motif partner protein TcmP n=1 Tax=Salipaludibacillus sp. HK11 TaxID=3394320 RepID=UPI0039FC05A4
MAYGKNDDKVGQWSVDKLALLKKYIPIFTKATQKAHHRYYIDCFAGKGEWIHKETNKKVEGSAVIAMKHAKEFTHIYLIEFDKQRVNHLNKLAEKYSCTDKVTILHGDCNEKIHTVMNHINKKAPTFVFLDPSKDQIKWKTIEFLSKWKTELFMLFPYHMFLNRMLPTDKSKITKNNINRMNEFLGTDEWQPIYYDKVRVYYFSEIYDLYSSRINNLGYTYIYLSNVFRVQNGPNLYYMIFAGKHKAGMDIMKWVQRGQHEQLKLF